MNKNIYPSLVVCLLAVFQLSAQSSIDGYIKSHGQIEVAHFNIALANANGEILAQTQTNCEGYYHFDELDNGADYQLVFQGSDNEPANISTLEAVFMSKHLTGVEILNPLQAFAADIDEDGHVTIIDLMHIRNYYLSLDTSFPGASWLIINSEQSQIVNEHQFSTSDEDTAISVDFYYTRKGDLNGGDYGC